MYFNLCIETYQDGEAEGIVATWKCCLADISHTQTPLGYIILTMGQPVLEQPHIILSSIRQGICMN